MNASFEFLCKEQTKKRVEKQFSEMGFNDVGVTVSTTNGESIYVNVFLKVIDDQKIFRGMSVCEYGYTSVQVRMSDHDSGLEKNCGGFHVDTLGAKMTLSHFQKLIELGGVETSN